MSIIHMPTASTLVALAILHSDFVCEIPPTNTARETYRAATIATNQAAEMWEEANGHPIGATVDDSTRNAVALALVAYADDLNRLADAENAIDLVRGLPCVNPRDLLASAA